MPAERNLVLSFSTHQPHAATPSRLFVQRATPYSAWRPNESHIDSGDVLLNLPTR